MGFKFLQCCGASATTGAVARPTIRPQVVQGRDPVRASPVSSSPVSSSPREENSGVHSAVGANGYDVYMYRPEKTSRYVKKGAAKKAEPPKTGTKNDIMTEEECEKYIARNFGGSNYMKPVGNTDPRKGSWPLPTPPDIKQISTLG